MNTLNLSSTLEVNPDVVYTQIDEDIVMMGPEDGMYYAANPVGATIWNLLMSKPLSLKALYEYIEKNYDVDGTQYKVEVATFIDEMIEQKMVFVRG